MIGPVSHINPPPLPVRAPEPSAPTRDPNALRRPSLLRPDEPVARSRADTQLTDEEKRQVQELKQRDAEVRAHEQAHKRAGGQYASAPTYQYTRGPDGGQYAVAGEVKIDASEIAGNPKATITKMEIVIRAALAPAEPSAQDMKVAAQARAAKTKAQIELRQQETQGEDNAIVSLQERYGQADARATASPTAAAGAYAALEAILRPHQATTIDLSA